MSTKAPKHNKFHRGSPGSKVKPRCIIIHTTESGQLQHTDKDRKGIINFLANKGISVPIVVDDDGSTEMVPAGYLGYGHAKCLTGKAWGIEQIGTARWTKNDWKKHVNTVRNAAQWTAWAMSNLMDLPVTKNNLKRLVKGHNQDNQVGGCSDHWDPGPNYPWKLFREEAVKYAAEKGYRIVATKEDKKIVKEFSGGSFKQLLKAIKKLLKNGFKVKANRVKKGDID